MTLLEVRQDKPRKRRRREQMVSQARL